MPRSTTAGIAGERPNLVLIEADGMRQDEQPAVLPQPDQPADRAVLPTMGVVSHAEPFGLGAFDDSNAYPSTAGLSSNRAGRCDTNGYGVQPTHGSTGRSSLRCAPLGWTEWWAGSHRVWKPGDAPGGSYAHFNLTSNVKGDLRTWHGESPPTSRRVKTRQLACRFARRDDRPWFVSWSPVAPHQGGRARPITRRHPAVRRLSGHLGDVGAPVLGSGCLR